MQSEPITGIILAGGKSSRFGTDKALYHYNGKRMIEYAIDVLNPICSEILLSTNKPDDYLFTGLKSVEDIYKGCGPLGGIHACLLQSNSEHNIIIGCDLPELCPDLLKTLLEHKSDYQIVIPIHKGLKETLTSYFNKNTIPTIENALKVNCFKLSDVIASLHAFFLDVEKMPYYSDKLFTNVNTKEVIGYLNQTDL